MCTNIINSFSSGCTVKQATIVGDWMTAIRLLFVEKEMLHVSSDIELHHCWWRAVTSYYHKHQSKSHVSSHFIT